MWISWRERAGSWAAAFPAACFAATLLSACGDAVVADPGAGREAEDGASIPPPDGTPVDLPPAPSDADGGAAPAGFSGPYPVVLAHGFFGFDDFANAGFLNYFYKVRETLTAEGYEVFTPTVDPFNDSADRAEELLAQVEAALAETGAPRAHLIGHSQGGLDVRAVASLRPDLVESVTIYGSPVTGLAIADVLDGAAAWDPVRGVLDALVRVVAKPIWGDVVDERTSLADALSQLSAAGLADFQDTFPDVPGMRAYSIAGRTDWQQGGAECFPADRPDFIRALDDELDPVDPFLAVAEAISDGGLGKSIANDGFVQVREARWGRFLGCVPADHLDQVGQLLGDSPGIGNDFDHISFLRSLIDWLDAGSP